MESIKDSLEFKILSKVAEGGMGTVYKALKLGAGGFEKIVAIKTLKSSIAQEPHYVEMFINEAKLVSRLVHENIVQLHQLGRLDNSYYFELEFVNGVTLYNIIDFHHSIRKKIPVEFSAYVISKIACALSYAHNLKDSDGVHLEIAHRDVCPNNIMISASGVPKLTDFGIAIAMRRVRRDRGGGKLMFMSPEQARNDNVDQRSDIFSLGIVLFLMLTGKNVRKCPRGSHSVQDPEKILEKVKEGNIVWSMLPKSTDDAIRGILEKALAVEPNDRYQDIGEMAADLDEFLHQKESGPVNTLKLVEYLRSQMPYFFNEKQRDVATLLGNMPEKTQFLHTELM